MACGSSSNLHCSFELCQLCEQPSHTAILCPYMYSKCMLPGCIGIRMIMISESNLSKGKNFLKCQFPLCDGFQWLEDALKCKGSSSIKCYICGDDDHAGGDCPWDGFPCSVGYRLNDAKI
ncbi:zinc finger protein [Macleaya cordata]|uniref:Zinc finger protein n=1 Tax=Macleaya cordata TaxID=56857 RepID=A0A200QYH1_MACCD|nr:zinc finger protein [Macleaya cordata]